eukprot:gnl/TRDRNA2_/TRDRNA2_169513_c2_seq1.p1 gnl/TRDRNA2_/TRDRNA2_169513_c2~~gnl/TRDRNA2_/TRDRNA2_169513_c2_seq1.p1  ORF type:complete len:409 (+),score=95.31 gnl/TRDRNA2_/TRDRNA2_169513_c2_seq1:101-1228(+)
MDSDLRSHIGRVSSLHQEELSALRELVMEQHAAHASRMTDMQDVSAKQHAATQQQNEAGRLASLEKIAEAERRSKEELLTVSASHEASHASIREVISLVQDRLDKESQQREEQHRLLKLMVEGQEQVHQESRQEQQAGHAALHTAIVEHTGAMGALEAQVVSITKQTQAEVNRVAREREVAHLELRDSIAHHRQEIDDRHDELHKLHSKERLAREEQERNTHSAMDKLEREVRTQLVEHRTLADQQAASDRLQHEEERTYLLNTMEAASRENKGAVTRVTDDNTKLKDEMSDLRSVCTACRTSLEHFERKVRLDAETAKDEVLQAACNAAGRQIRDEVMQVEHETRNSHMLLKEQYSQAMNGLEERLTTKTRWFL